MVSEKLERCPFCNGPAVNVAGEYVTCGSPTFLDCAGRSVKAAPATWNIRAPADLRSALEAETAALRAYFDAVEQMVCVWASGSRAPSSMDEDAWEHPDDDPDDRWENFAKARSTVKALAPTKGDAS